MARIFISYRRLDSGPVARRLAEALAMTFGEESVFLDTDSIRMGDQWTEVIQSSLNDSTVLVLVVGTQWLHIDNEYGQRRIDLEDDWVRTEIVTALERQIPLIPVLVNGASVGTVFAPAALPGPLKRLSALQGYEVRDEFWKRDLPPLLDRLIELGFERRGVGRELPDAVYPAPVEVSKALTREELDAALQALNEWRVVRRPGLDPAKGDRTELYRAYRFKSFEDAVHFMLVASRYASQTGHHPDWQNLWITVRVWLTTWDIGHRPTYKDVRLAAYLDKLYLEYAPA